MTKQNFPDLFQTWLSEYFEKSALKKNFVELLFKSQGYSLRSGGKRFRPYLAAEVFQVWNSDLIQIRNFCLAIEMIHTYSLIHDDLPCMDNDDFRRGQPTNHKMFQEDVALLAGDGLLTEAFYLISSDRHLSAEARVRTIELVSGKIGSFGMVGGQVLDMKATKDILLADLQQIHQMKTGCLIEAAAVGGAILAGASEHHLKAISLFSQNLGMAFQIKDDLLDIKDNRQDFKNYVNVVGQEQTERELVSYSQKAISQLKSLGSNSEAVTRLQKLVETNQARTS